MPGMQSETAMESGGSGGGFVPTMVVQRPARQNGEQGPCLQTMPVGSGCSGLVAGLVSTDSTASDQGVSVGKETKLATMAEVPPELQTFSRSDLTTAPWDMLWAELQSQGWTEARSERLTGSTDKYFVRPGCAKAWPFRKNKDWYDSKVKVRKALAEEASAQVMILVYFETYRTNSVATTTCCREHVVLVMYKLLGATGGVR